MPTTNLVAKQKLLHKAVLIGWGCLIYSHRMLTESVPDPWRPKHDYKMFLACISELFLAADLAKELESIESLFLNYDLQPKLREAFADFSEDLKARYLGSKLSEWYDNFLEHGVNFLIFCTIDELKLAHELRRALLMLEYFEAAFGFTDELSAIFLQFTEADKAHEFYNANNYKKLWEPLFKFLLSGYRLAPQELLYSFNNKNLIFNFNALNMRRPVSYKELQEDLAVKKTLDTVQIDGFDFSAQENNILKELWLLLQPIAKISMVIIKLSEGAARIFDQIKNEFVILEENGYADIQFAQLLKANPPYKQLLSGLCVLQAFIQSMPNVQSNNIAQDYWQVLLEPYDDAAKQQWIENLNKALHEYSKGLQIESSVWKVLREQSLHGYVFSKTEVLSVTEAYKPLLISRRKSQQKDFLLEDAANESKSNDKPKNQKSKKIMPQQG